MSARDLQRRQDREELALEVLALYRQQTQEKDQDPVILSFLRRLVSSHGDNDHIQTYADHVRTATDLSPATKLGILRALYMASIPGATPSAKPES